jgi:hypothetical protein
MSADELTEVRFRGPGLTRRQRLSFSPDQGLEGSILRPYEYVGLSLRNVRVDTSDIRSIELESEFNLVALLFSIVILAAVGWIPFAVGGNPLFWVAVGLFALLGAAQAAAAAWWAELRIKRTNVKRPLIVPVSGPSRRSVSVLRARVSEHLDRHRDG